MSSKRYGVFLRPDPETCWVLTQTVLTLRQQFGLVSASAFPPHVTLVGTLRTDLTAEQLIEVLNPAIEGVEPFTVYNSGVERVGQSWGYNVHGDGSGNANASLVNVANRVIAAVTPVVIPGRDYQVTPFEEYRFEGHLSLASHDLLVRPALSEEVGEFIGGLPLAPPATFEAQVYSLFQFTSDWSGEWWRKLEWEHLHSWKVQKA